MSLTSNTHMFISTTHQSCENMQNGAGQQESLASSISTNRLPLPARTLPTWDKIVKPPKQLLMIITPKIIIRLILSQQTSRKILNFSVKINEPPGGLEPSYLKAGKLRNFPQKQIVCFVSFQTQITHSYISNITQLFADVTYIKYTHIYIKYTSILWKHATRRRAAT